MVFDHPTVNALARHLSGAGEPQLVPLCSDEQDSDDPIAIVGFGCRLPGGVRDASTLWALLEQGRDAITPIPAERWDADAFYDEDPDAAGKMCTREAGIVEGIDQLDAQFFGISATEAAAAAGGAARVATQPKPAAT